ncbi:hypothetical protein ACET3Z_022132 [Daucus carota]
MYAKCGCIGDAVKAFEDLVEPNEVSFTAMMGVLAETDQVEEALKMFRLMYRIGISVDSISLSCVLGVFSRSGIGNTTGLLGNAHGRLIHGLIIRLGFEKDLHLGNSLLDMYAKTRDMESAEAVFNSLPQVSNVSWNVMIGGYGQDYQIGKALDYMQMMKEYGFEADEVTHVNMLAACIKSGNVETARKIFSNMACPSLVSWNAMLSGYFQDEKFKEAIKLFREMQFRNVQADRTTLAIILNSCAVLGLFEWGKAVHCTCIKGLNHTDIYVGSGLIGLYSKCNQADVAKSIFDRMPDRDIVCWNSMIAGLSLNSLDKEAFNLFKQMMGKGLTNTSLASTEGDTLIPTEESDDSSPALIIGGILGVIQALLLISLAELALIIVVVIDSYKLNPAQQYLELRSLGAPTVLFHWLCKGCCCCWDWSFGLFLATQPINGLAFVFDGVSLGASIFDMQYIVWERECMSLQLGFPK